MTGRRVSRTFIHLRRDAGGLHLRVPDIVPAVAPFLQGLGWSGHPAQTDQLALGVAHWPTLRELGLPHLGPDWRARATSDLWAAHLVAMARWRAGETASGSPTLLDLKTELARRESSPCRQCALRCLAGRDAGEQGACGATNETRVFSFELLAAEEPGLGIGIAPRLSGCNASCLYCSRPDGIPARAGHRVTPEEVAAWVDEGAARVDGLHWIGGNVDQELAFIFAVMTRLATPLPVIWNHNATATPEVTVALLEGLVDVWLPDLRFGPGPCAVALGAPVMSFANCTAAIEAELRQAATVCVRVLVVPNHLECCAMPILAWLAKRRDRLFVSLMNYAYAPLRFAAGDPQIGRCLTEAEMGVIDGLMDELKLRRVG